MIGFAGSQLTVSHLSDAMADAITKFVGAHPGNYRVLDFARPNNGLLLGSGDLGGNNPFVQLPVSRKLSPQRHRPRRCVGNTALLPLSILGHYTKNRKYQKIIIEK
jgi:hypothetical protein